MEQIKFFIYARKSSRGDDRQALSIPAQLHELNRLTANQNLKIAATILERESAFAPGRPKFNDMMRRIERGEAAGIIAWHPDRLARNSKDGGEIIYFLDIKKLVDLKFASFWFENTPQGKSNLGHEFVQSKQFSDKLSLDTKRGQHEKAVSGHYPGVAPRGYLNNKVTKTVVVDPHLAPVIKEAFTVYSQGDRTIEDMQEFFAAAGIFTAKRGNFVHREFIRRFLRNPFYYGHFNYGGEHYEGKHTPIISKQLFDKVQSVLAERGHVKSSTKEPKAFTKLVRCGECKMMITAEKKKGHIYYRCSKKSPSITCSQPYVREEVLTEELSRAIATCAMPQDMAAHMEQRISEEISQSRRTNDGLIARKRAELAELSAKQHRLLDAYIGQPQLIDHEMFADQKRTLLNEKKRLVEQLAAYESQEKAWLETFKQWVLTAKTLGEVAYTATPQEKKALALSIFGSNLTLLGKKALGQAVKPWSLIQNLPHHSSPVRCYEAARLVFMEGQPAS